MVPPSYVAVGPAATRSEAGDAAAILDAVAGLILAVAADGRVTFASQEARALLGADPGALIGLPLDALVRPEDGTAIDALAGACDADAVAVHLLDREGRLIPAEATVRALPGDAGHVVTLREAPEYREETLAALRMSRDHYRALADTLPQLIWMERADTGETIYVNRAFEEYCGPLPGGGEARTARFHPEDAARIKADCRAARARDQSCELQGRIRDRAGGYRWHQLVFRPLRKGGLLLGWLASALDIDEIVTARKALEETGGLLRLAQAAAGAGLFDVDFAAHAVTLSPESAGRHGLPGDRPAVIGLSDWLRRVAPADRAPTLHAIRAATRAHVTFDVAFRVPGNGAARWIQAMGRPHHDASGAIVRLTGLTLDITSRKDTERALVEAKAAADAARAQAERANAAKTDFLSAMSHEIRTPLNAVIGFADLLASSGRLDGELRRYADLARTAGESLRTVVDDILDFAAVESGAIALCLGPFQVRELIEQCLGIVGVGAAAKGLEIAALVAPEVPDTLVGDAGRLRQILLNLLNNAVKFTPRGGVTVGLVHEGRVPGGERLRFSVADTGIGIAPEHHGRLFDRFSQADGSIRRDFGGTGLGLAISRKLVERMGGGIALVSEPGRGSTFSVALTLPRAASTAARTPAEPQRPARRGRILLVEDVEINRELACTVLRTAGHAVDVAVDGIEAVRAVEAATYDLVLMDIQMPGIDGMMATRLIRCLPGVAAGVPVVAMTANVLPDQVGAFREAGMNDHFAKPFQPAELCAVVERWLGGAAEDCAGPDPTVDNARYEENLAFLAPETLGKLLRHFHARVRTAFAGSDGDDAGALRAEAHALAAAAGLLGFTPLSRACAALDTADEGAFAPALARARQLAIAAAAETQALIAANASAAGARP